MQPTVFKFIRRYSAREQILLLLMTVTAFPFLYLSLDLPKIIINEAIGGTDFPRVVLGYELDQIPYLFALCATFLGLVLINGAFKYVINVYRGLVGERMLRRLRYQLFDHVLRFPLPQFRRTSQGELVSMITAETEPLGGYIGDSVALPAFQGGTLLTILVFMFIQDWVLGLAAVLLYPVQAYLIPKLQRKVNALKKERVIKVRKLSERIGEVVGGIQEVHTHDTSRLELADFSERIGEIFHIRYRIYLVKFFIKFLNNFLAQITPFFFYSIGGYLVITGDLSFGALVAVLAAYKDLSPPWKELLNFYQIQEDARIKYELLYETFRPHGLMEPSRQSEEPGEEVSLAGELLVSNLDLREEDEGEGSFAGTFTLRTTVPARVALVGEGGSGLDRVASILAGLRQPLSGSVRVGDLDLLSAPEAVTGRRIAYVGREPHLRAGTVRENLYYPLKNRPVTAATYTEEEASERAKQLRDAIAAGGSEHDVRADWIDYRKLGVSDGSGLTARAIEVLSIVDMAGDIYGLGLQGTIDTERSGRLATSLLEARADLRTRLADPGLANLVELFDRDAYNTNMSVAENILFGTPIDDSFQVDSLAANAYMRKVLHETGLMEDFLRIGHSVAGLMVDLFAGVEPGSELFEQFSFIDADDLPEFRSLLARADAGSIAALDGADRAMLLSLPFKLIPARHRLGLVDEPLRKRLLEARRLFASGFGMGAPEVEFFDADHYNPAISIQDNILFGRLAYGKAHSASRVGEEIRKVLLERGLHQAVMEVGLDYSVGIGASRLGLAQRQKLAIARAVLKRPDVLVLDEATAALDEGAQARILDGLLEAYREGTLIWVLHRASLCEDFDLTVVVENGKVVAQGRFEELNRPETPLGPLLSAT